MNIRLALLAALAGALIPAPLSADVRLPSLFSDHMVLKQGAAVPVWGTADPGEEVTVTLNGKKASAKAGEDGRWKVVLDLKDSPEGPFEMAVEGKNRISIQDVVVGEVWVASGQSNMEWPLKNTIGAAEEIARSKNPMLRQFLVKKNTSLEPLDTVEGAWVEASPETSGTFTAVGYYFGKKLQSELKRPVGLINSTWGGTPSEAWTSVEAIDSVPDLKAARERLWKDARELPEKRLAFIQDMKKWVADRSREDKPVADALAFSGADVPLSDWRKIQFPGEVAGEGLPRTGAVWVRKELDFPEGSLSNIPLILPIDGFDSVYWNGRLLKQTTIEDFPGSGHVRRYGPYEIPADQVKRGKNVLAIRFYQPVGPASIPKEPKAGQASLSGEWLAKAEYEFPALEAAELASAPAMPPVPPSMQNVASCLFNAMIHPLIPYAIDGVIWYQGESNAGRAMQYRQAFPLLIADWRDKWGQKDLPFYFCQLANYMAKKPVPGDSSWAELREAQSLTLKFPKTGQAVLIDLGEEKDIHPRNKAEPGERLARLALAKDYGRDIVWSGPVYDSMKTEGGKIILNFKNASGGLMARPLPETYVVKSQTNESAPLVRNSPGSELEGFAICGEDRAWVWADARIVGNQVEVWSDKVAKPVAVRYAWADNPTANLYNGAGLPASPFRTDDFPPVTAAGKY